MNQLNHLFKYKNADYLHKIGVVRLPVAISCKCCAFGVTWPALLQASASSVFELGLELSPLPACCGEWRLLASSQGDPLLELAILPGLSKHRELSLPVKNIQISFLLIHAIFLLWAQHTHNTRICVCTWSFPCLKFSDFVLISLTALKCVLQKAVSF